MNFHVGENKRLALCLLSETKFLGDKLAIDFSAFLLGQPTNTIRLEFFRQIPAALNQLNFML
jgi:hypothetical protein